jgi:integrase
MGRPATGGLIEIRSTRTGEVTSYSARVTYKGRRRNVPLPARERPQAEAEVARIVEEIRRGIWVEPLPKRTGPPVPRFGGFAMEWFARQCLEGGRQRVGLAPATQAELRWALDHLLVHFARMPIDAITIIDVDRYRLAKVNEGRLSANSINKTLTTLAAILEMGVEYELIQRNPARGRRRRLAAATPTRPWLDRAEHISMLLDAATELDREALARRGQRRALLATLIFAGLRLGEALALRWEQVDLAAGTIRVGEAKTSAGVRTINLLPVLQSELRAYRAGLADRPDALVFATSTGGLLSASNVRQRVLAPAIKRADASLRRKGLASLPVGLTPHSLRRTFASLLFALGEPPPYVTSQMGHTTPSLTLAIYAKEMHRRDGEHAKLRALVEGSTPVDEPIKSSTSTTRSTARFSAPWLSQARR